MTNTHFTKLLLCYGVKKSKMGTKPQMKQKYKTTRKIIWDKPVVYCRWNSADKDDHAKLKPKEIAIGDTALGRLCDTHKRELEASYKATTPCSKSDTNILKKK